MSKQSSFLETDKEDEELKSLTESETQKEKRFL